MFNLCFWLPFLFGLLTALFTWLASRRLMGGRIEELEGEISTQNKNYVSLKTDYDGFF